MDNQALLQRAKLYIEKMANGIHPVTGQPVPEYDTLNDVRVSRCLFYVADLLRQVAENGGEVGGKKSGKKQPFTISPEQLESFAFSEKPISVSEIARRINALVDHTTMVNLKYKSITGYLMNSGLLTLIEYNDGSKAKEPTEIGRRVGISVEERMGQRGLYRVVVYNEEAQRFILDSFDGILALDHLPASKKENQRKPWTDEQDQQLKELYERRLPLHEIAKEMQRTREGIKKRLQKLGIAEG